MKQLENIRSRTATIALIASVVIAGCNGKAPISSTAPSGASVYDRVIQNGTIECGYGIYPPFAIKDVNTG
ncbi:MAG TPA: hypothetical protein VEX38_01325, partial [Fimbriimonadaceae bacterium]|nr:hypothetical protein [Fimbriimonadaceae bacterium]